MYHLKQTYSIEFSNPSWENNVKMPKNNGYSISYKKALFDTVSQKWQSVNQQLEMFIASDSQSFSVIVDKEFQELHSAKYCEAYQITKCHFLFEIKFWCTVLQFFLTKASQSVLYLIVDIINIGNINRSGLKCN